MSERVVCRFCDQPFDLPARGPDPVHPGWCHDCRRRIRDLTNPPFSIPDLIEKERAARLEMDLVHAALGLLEKTPTSGGGVLERDRV